MCSSFAGEHECRQKRRAEGRKGEEEGGLSARHIAKITPLSHMAKLERRRTTKREICVCEPFPKEFALQSWRKNKAISHGRGGGGGRREQGEKETNLICERGGRGGKPNYSFRELLGRRPPVPPPTPKTSFSFPKFPNDVNFFSFPVCLTLCGDFCSFYSRSLALLDLSPLCPSGFCCYIIMQGGGGGEKRN